MMRPRCDLPIFVLLGALNVAHIHEYVAARAHLSPKTVNNHLTLLTTMLNLAVELGWLARVPKIKKVKAAVCGPEYRYVSGLKHLADVFDAMLGSFERRKMRFARSLKTDRRRTQSVVMRPCCHTMT